MLPWLAQIEALTQPVVATEISLTPASQVPSHLGDVGVLSLDDQDSR